MTAVATIERLIERSPMEVAQLYTRWGIRKQPSVQTTLDAIDVFGEPFLMELFNMQMAEESFLGFGKKNKEKKTKTEEGAEKKTLWQKFKGIFSKGKEAAKDVSDTAGDVSKEIGKTEKTVQDTVETVKDATQGATNAATGKREEEKKEDEGISTTTVVMLVGVALTFVIVVIYFATQKK